jgi:hypothetical protein
MLHVACNPVFEELLTVRSCVSCRAVSRSLMQAAPCFSEITKVVEVGRVSVSVTRRDKSAEAQHLYLVAGVELLHDLAMKLT